MARHRSPRSRGTYPAPPQAAPARHARGGTCPVPPAEHPAAAHLAPGRGAVAVLDRPGPFAAPPPLVARVPLPRLPDDAWAPIPPADPTGSGAAPERRRQPVLAVRGRRGVAAVAAIGGAMAVVTATVPSGAFAGGIPALLSDATPAGRADTALLPAAEQQPVTAPEIAPEISPVISSGITPEVADVRDLVAGVRDAHAQVTEQVAAAQEVALRHAAEQAAAKAAADAKATRGDCGLNEAGLGAVKSYVRTAAEFIGCQFGEPTMYGVGGRGGASDHPGGKAVDFMVDRATGDRLAQCVLDNKRALGVSYVIWRQRINMGDGWEAMEDRGGVTANHFDHVHVSFGNGTGGGGLRAC